MGAFDWKVFSGKWSKDMLEVLSSIKSNLQLEEAESIAITNESLSFPPASQEAIADIEAKFGLLLPPSYRSFLEYSDGFLLLAMDGGSGRLLGASEIGLYRDLYPEMYKVLVEIHCQDDSAGRIEISGDSSAIVSISMVDAEKMIAVSTHDTPTVFLLNPSAISEDGEWEAWYLNFHSGTRAFRSFADLMEYARRHGTESYRELV